jgi:L-fuculose-phosphate aldolase
LPFPSRDDAIAGLLHASHVLAHMGCLPATDGNFSARLSENRILLTASGIEKRGLTVTDFIDVELHDENPRGGSSEWKVHRALYQARSDIHCVLHVHAPALTTFAAARKVPRIALLAEALAFIGEIALVPFALPGTNDIAESVVKTSTSANIYLLSNHGAVAVGHSILTALHVMERAEFLARVEINAAAIGGAVPLSLDNVGKVFGSRYTHE